MNDSKAINKDLGNYIEKRHRAPSWISRLRERFQRKDIHEVSAADIHALLGREGIEVEETPKVGEPLQVKETSLRNVQDQPETSGGEPDSGTTHSQQESQKEPQQESLQEGYDEQHGHGKKPSHGKKYASEHVNRYADVLNRLKNKWAGFAAAVSKPIQTTATPAIPLGDGTSRKIKKKIEIENEKRVEKETDVRAGMDISSDAPALLDALSTLVEYLPSGEQEKITTDKDFIDFKKKVAALQG